MNKKIVIVISFLIMVLLFVSAIAGTVLYYNGELNDKNLKISLLNSQIANLTNQVSNLTAEVTNLTSANLVNALNVTEMLNNSDLV